MTQPPVDPDQPGHSPPPYGQPMPYGYAGPGYGYGYGSEDHGGATTSMWLGIGGLVCLALGFACCVTFPGAVCLPVAWIVGFRAKWQIDAEPGRYRNRGQAVAGMVMGIIGTVPTILAIIAVVALFVVFANGDSYVPGTVYGNGNV